MNTPQPPLNSPHASHPGGPVHLDAPAKKNWFARHKVLTVVGVLVIVGVIAIAASNRGGDAGTETALEQSAGEDAAVAEQPADDAGADDEDRAAEEVAAEDDSDDAGAAVDAGAGIGEPVESGDLRLIVTAVEPGGTELGSEYVSTTAQGEFLLVHVSVENFGNEAEYFSSSSVSLTDDQGREHDSDASAAIYIPDNDTLFTNINPGNTVVGTIVFDLAADITPATVNFSAGLFDDEVSVSIAD